MPRTAVSVLLSLVVAPSQVFASSGSGGCAVIEPGICYPNPNDLARISGVSKPDDCCALCNNHTDCRSFTINFDGAPHGNKASEPTCILKPSVEQKKRGNCTSGSLAPTPPPPPPFDDYCKSHTCRNVLYFLSDDMRSDWHAYGLSDPITPNLDALAKESLLFTHAYCQISVCAPSRMSFMTSRRPDTFGVWNFIDTVPEDTQATPGHFKDHGYITLGLGKTFHQASGAWNAEKYWDLDEFPYFPYGVGKCPHGGQGGGHCVQKDEEIYDWHLRNSTIIELEYAIKKSKAESRPFYVMSGFRKPHAPWQAPQRMYDLYNQSALAVAEYKVLGKDTPLIAYSKQLSVQLENG